MEKIIKIFDQLSQSSVDGILGFVTVDSGRPGPVLGITACTHGNEPSGLVAIDFLLNEFDIQKKIKKGKVVMGINNLEACRRYLSGDFEKEACRFVDINMNRLPENLEAIKKDVGAYEIGRAKELLKIWRTFEVSLDIHSTKQNTPPMIINAGAKFEEDLAKGFPIKIILNNIDQIQIGKPAFAFYGSTDKQIPVIEIEAGQHESDDAFKVATETVLNLLQNLEMIDIFIEPKTPERESYIVVGSVVLPDSSYRLVREFKDFEFIPKDTLIANGEGDSIIAMGDCYTLFAPSEKMIENWNKTSEEAIFLLQKNN